MFSIFHFFKLQILYISSKKTDKIINILNVTIMLTFFGQIYYFFYESTLFSFVCLINFEKNNIKVKKIQRIKIK